MSSKSFSPTEILKLVWAPPTRPCQRENDHQVGMRGVQPPVKDCPRTEKKKEKRTDQGGFKLIQGTESHKHLKIRKLSLTTQNQFLSSHTKQLVMNISRIGTPSQKSLTLMIVLDKDLQAAISYLINDGPLKMNSVLLEIFLFLSPHALPEQFF